MTRARVGVGVAAGALLAIVALLYSRGLDAAANYDEGVYLASLDALRHGQELGSDVYASQPPGFYVLLQGLSLLPGDGVKGIRVALMLVALAGLAAAYFIGRKLAGGWGGFGAAALLAVTAPYPVQAARVQADTACVALSLTAIAVAFYAGRSSSRWAASGALAGAAVAVKLLALPVLAPLAVLLVARRSWRAAAMCAGGAAAIWAALLVAYADAPGELWESVFLDHRDARDLGPSFSDNVERVFLHPLDWRTGAAVLVVIGLVSAVVVLRKIELLALGAWVVASAVFLIPQRPLLDHHFVLLAATLAVPAGAGLGAAIVAAGRARSAVAGLALVLLALGVVQEGRRVADQASDPLGVVWAADQLRARTRPNELVGADLPIVAYLADRRVPGQLIDSSFVRLDAGSLTRGEILAHLDHNGVRAVVVGREYAGRPQLLHELAARYPRTIERDGVTIYLVP